MPTVITIPAIDKSKEFNSKIRVAAYCRVSTLSGDQSDSFINQTTYYEEMIKSHSEWEYVGIYADKGVTGTRKQRKEFQRLISDCKKGLIDLVLVKSISRFARNTVDCLSTVEELRGYGVSIYFERDNINTKSRQNDIMLSILGSCAQQESISTSRNLKLGIRARMEAGIYRPSKIGYGYMPSDVNFMEIDPESSKIVMRILNEYKYKGYQAIKQGLNKDHVPCKFAEKWSVSVIRSIVRNEKYMGDALLQKTYSPNTFPFERRFNKGEVRQVYYKESHPALIMKVQYDENQRIREYEKFKNGIDPEHINYRNRYVFSGKIYCKECGERFCRKVANKKTVTWSCKAHLESKELCPCKSIKDDELKAGFIEMCGKLMTNPAILGSIVQEQKVLHMLQDSKSSMQEILDRIHVIKEQSLKLNRQVSDKEIDFALFLQEQNKIDAELLHLSSRLELVQSHSEFMTQTKLIISELEKASNMRDTFSEELFNSIIEKIFIYKDNTIEFMLINGLQFNENIRSYNYD